MTLRLITFLITIFVLVSCSDANKTTPSVDLRMIEVTDDFISSLNLPDSESSLNYKSAFSILMEGGPVDVVSTNWENGRQTSILLFENNFGVPVELLLERNVRYQNGIPISYSSEMSKLDKEKTFGEKINFDVDTDGNLVETSLKRSAIAEYLDTNGDGNVGWGERTGKLKSDCGTDSGCSLVWYTAVATGLISGGLGGPFAPQLAVEAVCGYYSFWY